MWNSRTGLLKVFNNVFVIINVSFVRFDSRPLLPSARFDFRPR